MRNSLKEALILVADETESNIELLVSIFSEQEARTLSACDGTEAFEIIKERAQDIDLMVFDIRMPGMDGVKLTEKIRAMPEMQQTPIILITDNENNSEQLELGMEAGADDYLQKPIMPMELLVRSRSIIRQKKMQELKVVELNNEIIGHRDVAMFGWAKIAEYRDPETGSHLKRIQEYTFALAKRLQNKGPYQDSINQAFVFNIHDASPLHDIGKVGISDEILLKPGRLTTEEFEIMKTHTVKGSRILDEADQRLVGSPLIGMARDIALSHHERWDGSGYPEGLKGEETPLSARIMALADVYDALVSKRVYKDAIEHEDVLEIILESTGSHFDPAVVEAFAEISDMFVKIKQRFSDTL
jgi:putative two-component system response regulator